MKNSFKCKQTAVKCIPTADLPFQMYDKDGSGTIEMSEMVEVLETVYVMEGVISEDNTSMAKNRAKQIFSELDMDGNGSLTCDEFIEGKNVNLYGTYTYLSIWELY